MNVELERVGAGKGSDSDKHSWTDRGIYPNDGP